MVPQFATHRSPQNFHRPDDFLPERFLPADDPAYSVEFANDDRAALQPFALGPRNCIGRNLAYTEMRLVLVRMLWRFDLELADPSSDWLDQKVTILWIKTPLWVRLRPVSREFEERAG
jgi:averantin hydroxylase